MFKPSITGLLSVAFLAYMANSLWSIASLYFPPSCDSKSCLKNGLLQPEFKHGVRFVLMTTEKSRPATDKDMKFLAAFDIQDFENDFAEQVKLKLNPNVLKKNITQFLALSTFPVNPKVTIDKASIKWSNWIRDDKATFSILPLTKYHIPEAETFQLLGSEENNQGIY